MNRQPPGHNRPQQPSQPQQPQRQGAGTMVGLPPTSANGSTPISPMGWALRGLALLGVSVVSGLLWLAFTQGDSEDPVAIEDPRNEPKHDFKRVSFEDGLQRCEDVSTEAIQSFFEENTCEHLTRALYTTTLPGGERVLTSVVSVRMPNAQLAKQLDERVTAENTGNVQDLVADGKAPVSEDFPPLSDDLGYDSVQQQNFVVIGESAYFSDPEREDATLTSVTTEALKLGKRQDANQPG